MARKKNEEGKKGLDEWMATYSDMVTLLLCFFVLLYASSTPDETKWQYIFQAFNTTGTYINPFVTEENEQTNSETDEEGNSEVPSNSGEGTQENSKEDNLGLPSNFDELYAWFAATAESSGLENSVSVEQTSSSRIHIRFSNSIMFEGDSAVLLPSGKEALNLFTPGIKAIDEYIKNVLVQGHTAKGYSLVNDWDLSSARACSVIKYLDFRRVTESEKFVAEGHGPYSPIALGNTEEDLAKNRRVELIIVRNDVALKDTNIIQDILKYDYGISEGIVDASTNQPAGTVNTDDTVQQIVSGLEDKYGTDSVTGDSGNNDYSGPSAGIITEIPESALHEVDDEGNIIGADVTAASDTASEDTDEA